MNLVSGAKRILAGGHTPESAAHFQAAAMTALQTLITTGSPEAAMMAFVSGVLARTIARRGDRGGKAQLGVVDDGAGKPLRSSPHRAKRILGRPEYDAAVADLMLGKWAPQAVAKLHLKRAGVQAEGGVVELLAEALVKSAARRSSEGGK